MGRFKAIQINSLPPGNHSYGDCLYLRVKESGTRSWVFRYKIAGKARELGLGSVVIRSLREAHHIAIDMRRAIAAGIDPKTLLAKKKESKTFADYAHEFINSKRSGWRNAKHAKQWEETLIKYAFPAIGGMAVSEIDFEHIKKLLTPIWTEKPETASRVRGRIEAVIDYAFLAEKIDKVNPARWRGGFERIFPPRKKVMPTRHFGAIPYEKIFEVMEGLRNKTNISALCIRWIALTACRSGEARGMTWDEIDLNKKMWTIPGSRMKARVEHRVPLSGECIQILEQAEKFKSLGRDGLVFFNQHGSKLSDTVLLRLLKSISGQGGTIHGLRSGFRDWASEQTNFAHEVIEASLAHQLGAVEKAYRRTDLIEKRRALMEDWCKYLASSH